MENKLYVEDGKISIKELVNQYSSFMNENAKEGFLKRELTINTYISFAVKSTVTREIVKKTCLTENGELLINSQSRVFSHIIMILRLYTNLYISKDVSQQILDYDLLKTSGLYDKIIGRIPKSEIEEFNLLEKLAYEDLLNNKLSAKSYVKELVVKFAEKTNTGMEKLAEVIGKIDSKKLSSTLDKYAKIAETKKNDILGK